MYFELELMLRLFAAVVFGGLIGLERGRTKHEAGLRTHILVCLGAATVMIVSECLVKKYNIPQEIMRMGAQVISGVGFLGAGSIMSDSNKIRGITTAAGVWTTACVGLVVGSGYFLISAAITLLILFAMIVLKPITTKISSNVVHHILNVYVLEEKRISKLIRIIADNGIEINKIKYDKEKDMIKASIQLSVPGEVKLNDIIYLASGCEGIQEFNII